MPKNEKNTKANPQLVKILHTLSGLIAMGSALALAFVISFVQADAPDLLTWTKTPCHITESSGRAVKGGYKFLVQYEYDVNGATYYSNQYRLDFGMLYAATEAAGLARRFPKDKNTYCYVDPRNPNSAVLKKGDHSLFFLYLVCVGFFLGGVAAIHKAWFVIPPASSTGPKAEGYTFPERLAIACFYLTIVLGGLAYGNYLDCGSIVQTLSSRDWKKAECKVAVSRVLSKLKGARDVYKADILYSYTYKGRRYWSNAYNFGEGFSPKYFPQAAITKNYPKGSSATCFVNPKIPGQAVLKRDFNVSPARAIAPLMLIILGMFGVILTLKPRIRVSHMFKWLSFKSGTNSKITGSWVKVKWPPVPRPEPQSKPEVRNNRNERRPNRRASGRGDKQSQAKEQKIILKTRIGPRGTALGLLVFNLGLVGGLAYIATHASPMWGLISILLYVPIGLPVHLLSIPFIKAGLNPRVVVTIHASSLHLGDEVGISWESQGSLKKARELIFSFEGKEKFYFKKGKGGLSERHLFFKEERFKTSDSSLMKKGEAVLKIPRETMHSLETLVTNGFETRKLFIIWKLKVHLVMEGRKDTRNKYLLHILPLDLEGGSQ